jgi:ankyrin repeat protein
MSGAWKTLGSDRALRCAELLLAAGADVEQCEKIVEGSEIFTATPLWRTLSAQRHYALAERLLEHGADPNPAVFAVTFSAEQEGCELLDRFGANWEQRFEGRTCLMDLMHFRKPAASVWLIERGVDVNAADSDGKTALHYAAAQRVRADYVQALIDAGADRLARDSAGRTPLDFAKEKKRSKLMGLLGG